MKVVNKIVAFALVLIFLGGCSKDFLNTRSSNNIGNELAETTPEGLYGILEGLHNMMYMYGFGQRFGAGQPSLSAQLDFMGDDVINTLSAFHMSAYRYTGSRNIVDDGSINYKAWDYYYTIILHANKLVDNVNKVADLTEADKKTLLGEGYAFRAWAYHNLVQLFGKRYEKGAENNQLGVIIRTPDKLDEELPRSTVAEVYNYIDKDIKASLKNLETAPDKKRKNAISYAVACGIAARIALTKSEWQEAEQYADLAIKKSGAKLQEGNKLIDGFNDWKATEWMWAYTQAPDQSLGYAGFFATYSYNFDGHNDGLRFAVNRDIYDLMGENDVRRKWWVCLDRRDEIPADAYSLYFRGGIKNPNWEITGQSIKYRALSGKDSRGDVFLMRLAEMYYIKAEAQTRQGKDAIAQATLKEIMLTRDPNYNVTFTGDQLANEVLRNKRIDLWLEGQRFFDMKRLKQVPNRLNSKNIQFYLKGPKKETAIARNSGNNVSNIPNSVDSKYWQFLIPYGELKGNPLVQQNEL